MTDIKNKDVLGAPLWRNYNITVSPNFVDHDTGQYGCAFAIPAKGKARLKSYPSGVAADPSMFSVQVITLYDGTPLVILIGPCPGVYVISIDYGGGYLNDYTVQLKDSPYFQLVKPNEDTHPTRLFMLKENGLLLASGRLKYFFDHAPAGEPTTPVALDGTNSFGTTSGGQSKAVFIAANVRTFEAVWDQLLYLTTDFKLYAWGFWYDNYSIENVEYGYHTKPQLILENVASFGQLGGGDGLVWSEINTDRVYALGLLGVISRHDFPNQPYHKKQLLFTQRTPAEDLEYRQKRWSPVGEYQGEISFDVTYPVNERRFINDYVKVRCFGNGGVAIIDRFGDLYLGANMLTSYWWSAGYDMYWFTADYKRIYYPVLSLSAQNVADVYRTGGYTFYCTEGDRKLFVAAGAKEYDQYYTSYSAEFTNNYLMLDFSYDSRELIAGSRIRSFDFNTVNPAGYAKTTWYEIATRDGCYKLPCGRGGIDPYYPGAHCIGWLDRTGWPEYKGVNWFYLNLCRKSAFNFHYEAVFPYQADSARWPNALGGGPLGVSEYVLSFPYYEVAVGGYVKDYENIFISDYNLIQVWSAYNAHYQDYCGLFVAGEVPYDMTIKPLGHEYDTNFYQCVALSVTHFLANNYLEVY